MSVELTDVKIDAPTFHSNPEENEKSTTNETLKKLKIFYYQDDQVYLLDKRFQRLQRDGVKLLSKSQTYDKITKVIKIITIIFSLSSSYLSAVSGINEMLKNYLITSFSLLCAVVSGISSIKNYSSESTRLYIGYTNYLLKCSEVEQAFYHFEGTMPYDELVLSIDRLFAEYEKDIEKTTKEQLSNAEKRIIYTQEVIENHLRSKNNGELPKWYNDKVKLEDYKDRYDLNLIKKKKEEQEKKKTEKLLNKSLYQKIKDKIFCK
jgi:hypothetical protein